MRDYYRVMLGKSSIHAKECVDGSFIGTDYGIRQDLTEKLPEDWRAFNREFIPIYQHINNMQSKVSAGLACGALWTVSKGIRVGDIVLCPDGKSHYHVGEVISEYYFKPDGALPHRRGVRWFPNTIDRGAMSEALKNSTGSVGTISKISGYASELEILIGVVPADPVPMLSGVDPAETTAARVEEAVAFKMEKYLEQFLIDNWAQTPFGSEYEIYQGEGDSTGQQFMTEIGPLDILAISKDKKTLLVVELKKGRASDVVVGQILRYMGWVKEELANSDQTVKGVIIALEDDKRIRHALSMVPSVAFYRYKITFKLDPVVNQQTSN